MLQTDRATEKANADRLLIFVTLGGSAAMSPLLTICYKFIEKHPNLNLFQFIWDEANKIFKQFIH